MSSFLYLQCLISSLLAQQVFLASHTKWEGGGVTEMGKSCISLFMHNTAAPSPFFWGPHISDLYIIINMVFMTSILRTVKPQWCHTDIWTQVKKENNQDKTKFVFCWGMLVHMSPHSSYNGHSLASVGRDLNIKTWAKQHQTQMFADVTEATSYTTWTKKNDELLNVPLPVFLRSWAVWSRVYTDEVAQMEMWRSFKNIRFGSDRQIHLLLQFIKGVHIKHLRQCEIKGIFARKMELFLSLQCSWQT